MSVSLSILVLIQVSSSSQPQDVSPEALIGKICAMSAADLEGDCIVRRSFLLDFGELDDSWYSNPLYGTGNDSLPHPRKLKGTPVEGLVAMGARAVPALLAHLEDTRETKWDDSPMGFAFFDLNPRNTRCVLSNIALPATREPLTGYIELKTTDWRGYDLKPLGDVCFFVLGQIVNRNYQHGHVRGLGTCEVAELAQLARTEWAGLTEEGLSASLRKDLLYGDTYDRRIGAALRLKHYDKAVLVPTVLKTLALTNEFIAANIVDYYIGVGAPPRYPNFIFPAEFELVLGAVVDVGDERIDAFCDEWLRRNADRAYDDAGPEDLAPSVNGMDEMGYACCRRLLMHTKRYDATVKSFADALIVSGRDHWKKEGQWIHKALSSPERFTWRDKKWYLDSKDDAVRAYLQGRT